MIGGIAHDAHLGGALTGILAAGTIDFQALTANTLLLGGVAVPIVLFFLFNKEITNFLRN